MEENKKKYYTPDRLLHNVKDVKHRSDYIVFFTFLMISAFFWLLINLSKEYSWSYNMKVELYDPPVNKLITKQADSTIVLNIKAQGFYLLKLGFMKPDELIIRLKNYTIHKSDDNLYYISTRPLKEKIAKLLDISTSNVDFSKNTISFYLERLSSKKVKVIPRLTLNFADFYNLYKPLKVKPERVTVYSTKSILDTITEFYTKPMEIENIKSSANISLEIDNPMGDFVRVKPKYVTVYLNVAKFTQGSTVVAISSTAKTKNIHTFPSKVTVYYNVALKDYDKVKPSDFKVVPDVVSVNLRKAKKLNLKIVKKPSFVRNVRVEPSQVEFIIIQ